MRSVPPICRHSFFFVRKVFFCNAFGSCLYFIHPHFSLWNFWLHMRIPRFGLQISGLSFMPLSFPLSSELLLPLDPSTSSYSSNVPNLFCPWGLCTCYAFVPEWLLLDLSLLSHASRFILAQMSPSQIYLSCHLGCKQHTLHITLVPFLHYSHCP